MLEIFKKICSIQNNVELFLVGDGQEKEALEKQAKDLNISENVRFLGSRSDVADLMNLFDVFVFPSIYEGLPLVLVEAQAADLPCVVSEAIVSEAIFTDKIKKLYEHKAEIEEENKELKREIRELKRIIKQISELKNALSKINI